MINFSFFNYRTLIILSIILFFIGINFLNIFAQSPSSKLIKSEFDTKNNLKIFDSLWTTVNEKYFDKNFNGKNWAQIGNIYRSRADKAPTKEALLIVLREMLSELKTSHLAVWISISEKQLEQKTNLNIDSKRNWFRLDAGFDTITIGDSQIVSNIEKKSSAQTEGVKLGWTLVKIEKTIVKDHNWASSVEFRDGESLNYSFLDEKNELKLLSLTNKYIIKSYIQNSSFINNNLGYIKFSDFNNDISKWFKEEILKFKNTQALIIDLRGNRGGLVAEVRNVLSNFFDQDINFGDFIERNNKVKSAKVKRSRNPYLGKVYVLVDEFTGSGAEIFSSILQENKRGLLIGTKTSGKVLNSLQYSLPYGFELLVAVRNYLSPNGRRLEGIGIQSDIEVSLNKEEIKIGNDQILEHTVNLNLGIKQQL